MKFNGSLKKYLENPFFFNFFEKLMGARRPRKRFVDNFVKPTANENILDIGCGTGELLDFFPDNINYLGIDNNPEYIDFAKKKYNYKGNFICSDINNKNNLIKNNYYDVVMCAGVIHHLDDISSKNLLKKSLEFLKKGGRFVSFDPVLVPNQKFLSKLLVQNDRGNYVRNVEKYENLISEIYENYKIFQKNDLHYYNYDILIMTAYK